MSPSQCKGGPSGAGEQRCHRPPDSWAGWAFWPPRPSARQRWVGTSACYEQNTPGTGDRVAVSAWIRAGTHTSSLSQELITTSAAAPPGRACWDRTSGFPRAKVGSTSAEHQSFGRAEGVLETPLACRSETRTGQRSPELLHPASPCGSSPKAAHLQSTVPWLWSSRLPAQRARAHSPARWEERRWGHRA